MEHYTEIRRFERLFPHSLGSWLSLSTMVTSLPLLPCDGREQYWFCQQGALTVLLPGLRSTAFTYPNAVQDGSCFAFCSLWVPNEIIPGTKHPPAEGVIFIGSTG